MTSESKNRMHLQIEQPTEWDYGIEVSVGFYYWSKMPVIDKCRPDGDVGARLKTPDFRINFFDDVSSDLGPPLDFDNIERPSRLNQQVYLAAPLTK